MAVSSPETVKFLIVDDLPENIRALEALLARDGLELHTAANGNQALELLLRNDYALALLDVQMPDMDGFELAELMRGTERTRHVPIIFITAVATDETRRFRGYETGAVDFIFKPVDPVVMRSKAKVFFDIGFQQQALNRQRDELRKTTLELSDALGRLQAHSDNSPLGIVEFDPDLRILGWSKGAERLFGFTAAEMLGRSINVPGWLPPEQATGLLVTLGGAMADQQHRRSVEPVSASHRNGAMLACEWYVSVLRTAPGRPISLNVQILDVTDRRRAEETQRLLIGELNHRVKNTLASVQAITSQTLRHTSDLKQFSTTFSGRLQALARAHNMLSDTTWQGARLDELILDQLRLGTLDEQRISISGPEINLPAGPAVRLALIFHELCTNANKYGALSRPEGRIELSWSLNGNRLDLTWRETGLSGVVAPERRGFGSTLIEQSLRADNGRAVATYNDDGVTWQIEMELAPPEGTALERRVASASIVPGPAPSAGRTSPIAGRRLLVVEDEPLIGLELVTMLEDAGAEVTGPVGTVEEALALLGEQSFDAAFLDGNLRGHTVEEVASRLTKAATPFVFLSGYGRESLPSAFAHVTLVAKPFSPEQVLGAARQLVAEHPGTLAMRSRHA